MRDYYNQLTDVQQKILEKELEVESIKERLDDLKEKVPTASDGVKSIYISDQLKDALHKAGVKYRFEKTRLLEIKSKEVSLLNKIKLWENDRLAQREGRKYE